MAARKAAKKAAKRSGTTARSVEDRVAHLENIQRKFLDAHGETYPGAGNDRAFLGEVAADEK